MRRIVPFFVAINQGESMRYWHFISLLSLCLPVTANACTSPGPGWRDVVDVVQPGATTLVYDPEDGSVVLHGESSNSASVEIMSANSLFIVENANSAAFAGLFDILSPDELFFLQPTGVGVRELGNVLPAGLSAADLSNELTIVSTCAWNYLLVVPEPNCNVISIVLLVCGIVRVVRRRIR